MAFQELSEGWKWLPWLQLLLNMVREPKWRLSEFTYTHLWGALNCRAKMGKSWLAPVSKKGVFASYGELHVPGAFRDLCKKLQEQKRGQLFCGSQGIIRASCILS